MVVEVKITGKAEVKAASRRVRESGNPRAVRKELNQALREAAAPAVEDVKQAALHLPAKSHRRILRQRIADSTSAQAKSGGRDPSVAIRISRARMKGKAPVPQLMDKGPFRHPVFGREKWVQQDGFPKWFEKAVEKSVPEVRERVKEAADHIEAGMSKGI
jgi:hypothetical protein